MSFGEVLPLLIFFYALCAVYLTHSEEVIVKTSLGEVKGVVLKSDKGRDFYAFRGIPYAKPPLGHLRFKVPEPVEGWENILDASKDGPDCIQTNYFASAIKPVITGVEDCLFLNIYTPSINESGVLPVMVYIHGGGLISGSGSSDKYGPQRLMNADIVLVTFNYRLGPFGFLTTGDSSSRGNYGFLDQLLVIKFVKEHVDRFGGDSKRVTLFGQSSGGASVSLHQLSPLSIGLFHAAIQQSGHAFYEWAFETDDPTVHSRILATHVQCPTQSNSDLVKCLRNQTASAIINATLKMYENNLQEDNSVFIWKPTVDNISFLAHPNQLILNRSNVNAVPTMSGVTAHEGFEFLLMVSTFLGGIDVMNSSHVPRLLTILLPKLKTKNAEFFDRITAEYFKGVDESDLSQRLLTLTKIIDAEPLKETDDNNIKLTAVGVPVYPYKFAFRGSYSWFQSFPEYKDFPAKLAADLKLVGHGDEIQYLFRSNYFKSSNLSEVETKMSEILVKLWTDFAKAKKPFLVERETGGDIEFQAMNIQKPHYMELNLESKIIPSFLNDKYEFWNNIYKNETNSSGIKTDL